MTFERVLPRNASASRAKCEPISRRSHAECPGPTKRWSCWRLSWRPTPIVHSRSGHPAGSSPSERRSTSAITHGLRSSTRAARGRTTELDDEHGRGLAIVAAIAGEDNWGIEGDERSPRRLVPARLRQDCDRCTAWQSSSRPPPKRPRPDRRRHATGRPTSTERRGTRPCDGVLLVDMPKGTSALIKRWRLGPWT